MVALANTSFDAIVILVAFDNCWIFYLTVSFSPHIRTHVPDKGDIEPSRYNMKTSPFFLLHPAKGTPDSWQLKSHACYLREWWESFTTKVLSSSRWKAIATSFSSHQWSLRMLHLLLLKVKVWTIDVLDDTFWMTHMRRPFGDVPTITRLRMIGTNRGKRVDFVKFNNVEQITLNYWNS